MRLTLGAAFVVCTLSAGPARAQWQVSGANIFYSAGNVGVGVAPAHPFHVTTGAAVNGTRAIFAHATAPSGITNGVYAQSASDTGRGVFGWATSATGVTQGVMGQSGSTSGRGVLGLASAATGVTNGVMGQANSTGGRGVYGVASAATGDTIGVLGQVSSTTGRAMFGLATATSGVNTGVMGQANSAAGRGVYGLAGAATGDTIGVLGQVSSTTGRGIVGLATSTTGVNTGVMGQSNSAGGRGVYGMAGATSGNTVGVLGQVASGTGNGVFGLATATTGVPRGVLGEARGSTTSTSPTPLTTPAGVLGRCTAVTGTNAGVLGHSPAALGAGVAGFATGSGQAIGVYGETQSPTSIALGGSALSTTGANFGVYGHTESPADGWAVYGEGDTGASGTKLFHIDHPLDPENKYLNHFSAEGPEPMLVYRGNALLDEHGAAWVALPDYFEALNTEYTYLLTPIGAPALLYVATEIEGNRFRIAGGQPGMKVSWTVTGRRNDPYVRAYGKPVEQEKSAEDRGRYLRPELYGKPSDLAVRRTWGSRRAK